MGKFVDESDLDVHEKIKLHTDQLREKKKTPARKRAPRAKIALNKTEIKNLKDDWKLIYESNLKRMKNYTYGLPTLKRVNELINKL